MDKGYVRLWRKTLMSDLWQLPPLEFRVFSYVLMEASYKDRPEHNPPLVAGELSTTYNAIATAVAWRENRRIVTPTYKQVRWAIKRLCDQGILTSNPTALSPQQQQRQGYLHVKVLHWDEYQSPEEATRAGTRAGQGQDKGNSQRREEGKKKKKTIVNGLDLEELFPEESSADPTPPAPSPAETIYERWKRAMGKNGGTTFDPKRRSRVEWALAHYSLEECLTAIDNCAADPFSMGDNDRGKKFNDLTLIFRDAEHVERFIDLPTVVTGRNGKSVATTTSRTERIAQCLREIRREGWDNPHLSDNRMLVDSDDEWQEVLSHDPR